MNLTAIVTNLRFQDLLDILFLSVLAYYLFLWFRGTKAFNALVGLIVLGIVFTLAQTWGLFLTTWVFQIFWQVLVILLIILFQSEIRQVLEKVDPLQALGLRKRMKPGEWLQGFSEGVFSLAERKIGALLIIQRHDRVEQWITGGQELEAQPGREVLITIFQKDSPLHDGAAVIRGGRLALVATYLPLSSDDSFPKDWGTRHRAAMGLSEKCDALVVVVSEERGVVTLVSQKKATPLASPEQLSIFVQESMQPLSSPRPGWKDRGVSFLVRRWKIKAGALALVLSFWLLLAGQQNFEVALTVPVQLSNVPAGIEVVEPMDPHVQIRFRGLRKDAGTLSEKNVRVELDISASGPGRKVFPVTREEIRLPNERVSIVSVEPSQMAFKFQIKSNTE